MMIRYFILLCLFGCVNVNAQFAKKFDIEVSHGWMKNYNKGDIQTGKNVSILGIPATEEHLWTTMLSISLGFKITKKHSIRIAYRNGSVGSRLDGSFYTPGSFEGPSFTDLLDAHNTIQYHSFGLHYSFSLPIDNDFFLFQIGASRQVNSFADTFIAFNGILKTNYNVSGSIGFCHSIFKNVDLVPRITVINSFTNKEAMEALSDTRFVPIQIGFELGLRLRV